MDGPLANCEMAKMAEKRKNLQKTDLLRRQQHSRLPPQKNRQGTVNQN